MWTEKVPGRWQEGLAVRGRKVMEEAETFFCRAAGHEVGDMAQQEKNSGSAAKPRGQKTSTAKAARPQTGSSFRLNQT